MLLNFMFKDIYLSLIFLVKQIKPNLLLFWKEKRKRAAETFCRAGSKPIPLVLYFVRSHKSLSLKKGNFFRKMFHWELPSVLFNAYSFLHWIDNAVDNAPALPTGRPEFNSLLHEWFPDSLTGVISDRVQNRP